MDILKSKSNRNILISEETRFGIDLGWEENFQEFERETLRSIINPIDNFETVRYIHNEYIGINGISQNDIWYHFYFFNSDNPPTYFGGLNYEYVGLSPEQNSVITKSENTSFFSLEFYKAPSGEIIDSNNRKLVFTKHLPIPLGEKVFYTPIGREIYLPIFTGNNYRNKENMFLFWFQDDTVLKGSIYKGDTFYVTAKYYNAIDGTILSFLNSPKSYYDIVNESTDVYHRMVVDKNDYSYIVYSGNTSEERIGLDNQPVSFYAYGYYTKSLI